MRYALILGFLLLAACAKDKKDPPDETYMSCSRVYHIKELILMVGSYEHDQMIKYVCGHCFIAWKDNNADQKITWCEGDPIPIGLPDVPPFPPPAPL